jgi:hypothetical protein
MALPDPLNKTNPPVDFTPTGAGERKEAMTGPPERAPMVEISPPKEVGPEVKDWLTRLETGEEIQLPQAVTDDQGQPLVSPAQPAQVAVSLPLTDEEMNRALHLKIVYAARWLAEWMKRLVKIVGGKFTYKGSK